MVPISNEPGFKQMFYSRMYDVFLKDLLAAEESRDLSFKRYNQVIKLLAQFEETLIKEPSLAAQLLK